MVLTSSPSLTVRIVAEDDGADFGFFEVEREAVEAAGELEHLIEHGAAETFDLGHTVTDFTNRADVGFGGGSVLNAFDFRFEFLQNVAHG